jgi:Flp pilus assembly protein TadG
MKMRAQFFKLRQKREDWSEHPGQVLVMFALMILFLVGMLAISVDAGYLMSERRQVQSAADSAALAAARAKLDYRGSPTSETVQRATATEFAQRNAVLLLSDIEVDPAPAGLGEDFVRVDLRADVQPFFLRAVYTGNWFVNASAVASIQPVLRPYALLALGCGPSGQPGIYINGSGYVNAHEGSIMSNCGIGRAGDSNTVLAAGAIDANGTIDFGSNWSAGQGFNQRDPLSDPIIDAGIIPPDRADAQAVRSVTTSAQMTGAITNLSNVSTNSARCPNNATCVMQPGYYGSANNSTALTLDVRGTLQMQPGLYYFGNGFRLEGQASNSRIQGTNIMLYFTDNARFDPGNAVIDLEAAQTSHYTGGQDGMLIWIANGTPFMMQSNGQFLLDGVIYAPQSRVRLYGSPSSNGVQVIVGSLELSGGGNFDILFTEYVEANIPRVFLVQ